MLDECNEPFAKQCRLCRVRRLYSMHDRLCHDQIPQGMQEVIGNMALLNKYEMWSADDEKSFRFDVERGRVYWNRELVDLVKICDRCLEDANRAASCCTRFEEIYQIPASIRKETYAAQKDKERKAAELIAKLFLIDIHRKNREFALDALAAARHGKRLERDEEERQRREKERLEREAAALRARKEMLDKAQSVDEKWKKQVHTADTKAFKLTSDYINLGTLPLYTPANPAPKLREHPHSWQLAPLHETYRIPLTAEAASERFGLGKHHIQNEYSQLTRWTNEVKEAHSQFLRDQEELKEQQALCNARRVDELKQYVDARSKQINRHYERVRLTLQLHEENQRAARVAEKLRRRNARLAFDEANERAAMEREDARSWQLRFYVGECGREAVELASMRIEEAFQHSFGDRFWGLDVHSHKMRLQGERDQQAWEERINRVRDTCIRVRITKPLASEVRAKVFRDKVTNEVIK